MKIKKQMKTKTKTKFISSHSTATSVGNHFISKTTKFSFADTVRDKRRFVVKTFESESPQTKQPNKQKK